MCGEEKGKGKTRSSSGLDPVWLVESPSLKLGDLAHPFVSQCQGSWHQEVKAQAEADWGLEKDSGSDSSLADTEKNQAVS